MMISCIFIASVPTKSYAKGRLEVYMPEMITRDYPFMHTVAELLANTNHKITAPEADIKLYKDYSFDINVKYLYGKNKSYHNPEIDFNRPRKLQLKRKDNSLTTAMLTSTLS